jgi:hypothetical protein
MTRSLFLLVLVIVVAALAWAAPPVSPAAVYRINFSVRLGDAIPAGALVTCKVRIVPELAAGQPGMPAPTEATATSVATVTGSVAHCTVEIPSTWAAADARRAAVLSYEVDAATAATVHTVAGQGMELPRLPAGGVEQVELSLML